MTTFSDWVDALARARGIESDYALARHLGVSHTAPPRWRTSTKPPEAETLRKVATAFNAPMQEVLVAAGYLRPEESGVQAARARLELASNRELTEELLRRLGEVEGSGDVVVAMGSAAPDDPSEPVWPNPKR